MDTILSIDLGTTYFKAALFDREMKLLGLARRPTPVLYPQEGWREITPEDFKKTINDLMVELRETCPDGWRSMAAITFSTQTNSFLLLDSQDRPLTPIILWNDERAAGDPPSPETLLPDARKITGVAMPSHLMMTVKLAWLRQRQPALFAPARRLCLISDYLTLWLTGAYVTEAGASGITGLLDIQRMRWWWDACAAAKIPLVWLPSVMRAGTDLGPVRAEIAEAWGLPRTCRFVVGCLDQYAGAIGAGNCQPGEVSETTGTVLTTMRCSTRLLPPSEEIFQGPSFQPGWYWQMALDNYGASSLENFRNALPDLPDFSILDAEAEQTPPGADGLRLIRPIGADKETDPRDSFSGLTPNHTRAHMARCIMETIAYALDRQIQQLCGADRPNLLRCCGGAARSRTWLQIKADILNIPCAPPVSPEPACFGAALLAASGLGWGEHMERYIRPAQRIIPRPEVHRVYQALGMGGK